MRMGMRMREFVSRSADYVEGEGGEEGEEEEEGESISSLSIRKDFTMVLYSK